MNAAEGMWDHGTVIASQRMSSYLGEEKKECFILKAPGPDAPDRRWAKVRPPESICGPSCHGVSLSASKW